MLTDPIHAYERRRSYTTTDEAPARQRETENTTEIHTFSMESRRTEVGKTNNMNKYGKNWKIKYLLTHRKNQSKSFRNNDV